MGRVFKLLVVFVAVLAVLVLAFGLIPALLRRGYSPGGWSGYTPPTMVEEQYPVLETLNYTMVGAREHASWVWSALGEYSQDDPSIAPYLEWLRGVLSYGFSERPFVAGDYIVVDTPREQRVPLGYGTGWYLDIARKAALPAEGSKIRVGYIRLPFGYGIIVTAYQDEQGYVDMVVHGTVVNETEFFDFAVRVVSYPMFGYDPPAVLYLQSCIEPTTREVCEESPWIHGGGRRFRLKTYWVLWRVVLEGSGHLEVNETLRIPLRDVYVLIEMPLLGVDAESIIRNGDLYIWSSLYLGPEVGGSLGAYYIRVVKPFEPAYLSLSHPVFGLASNFATIEERFAYKLALFGVTYSYSQGGFKTVLDARFGGGAVCHGFSSSSAMVASLLGYPAVSILVNYTTTGHAVSGFLRLSSLGEWGRVSLPVDLDLDGSPERYDVLADTAILSLEMLENLFEKVMMYCPPLVCVGDGFESYAGLSMALVGVPQVVLGLPEWLKTPALIKYQFLTEALVNRSLSNHTLYEAMVERAWLGGLYGYVYDPHTDTVVPAPSPDHVYWVPREEFLVFVEPTIRVIFRDKGIGPGFFTPPSAPFTKRVLDRLPLLYEKTGVPDTRRYIFEVRERLKQLPETPQTPILQVPTPTPEPPKPVEVEVVLEPVYEEVVVYRNDTYSLVAYSFNGWEGRVVVEGNEYTVRLYPSKYYPFASMVYVLEVERLVGWYTWGWQTYYQELPANGTRVELTLEGRRVVLTVYYKPAGLPDIGVVEVSEDALSLYKEYEYVLDGELITARLYVINATTIRGAPALIAQRNGTVVVVFGTVGTLYAGVSVQVYGVSSRIRYTVTAELVLPNGTAIPLKLDWWSANPPETGFIYVSTGTEDLPRAKLSGSTLRITVQEINLTVLIRIPS